MSTVVLDSDRVSIPTWVSDVDSFRRWAHSEEFPEAGRICFLNGEVWVDMSREQFAHNQLKRAYGSVLTPLSRQSPRGLYFVDGFLLTNVRVGLSTNPDGMFVTLDSLRSGRARLVEGLDNGFVELEGTPDMALEIVSRSSVEKDTEVLRELYWKARIPEYWLVNPLAEPLSFDILRHTSRGYTAARKQAGWLRSGVFGKSFHVSEGVDALGHPKFVLEAK